MLWTGILSLIFILQEVEASRNEKYCKLPCNDGSQNIACNPIEKLNGECNTYDTAKYNFVDISKRNLIVSRHNEFRNTVAGGKFEGLPASALMYRLIWDEELALMATIALRKCTYGADYCSATTRFDNPGYRQVLQIYGKDSLPGIEKILNTTTDLIWEPPHERILPYEIKKFRDRYKSPRASHFMLVIIGRSHHLGCAALKYSGSKGTYFRMLCYYSYKNIRGCPVYKIGAPGSKCPYGKDKEYPNLCISF